MTREYEYLPPEERGPRPGETWQEHKRRLGPLARFVWFPGDVTFHHPLFWIDWARIVSRIPAPRHPCPCGRAGCDVRHEEIPWCFTCDVDVNHPHHDANRQRIEDALTPPFIAFQVPDKGDRSS